MRRGPGRGFNADRDTDMRSSRLLYVERGLFSSQLAGDHEFSFASENLNGDSGSTEESDTQRASVYAGADTFLAFNPLSRSAKRT